MDSRNVRDKMDIDKRTRCWGPEDDEKATSRIQIVHVCFPEVGDSVVSYAWRFCEQSYRMSNEFLS